MVSEREKDKNIKDLEYNHLLNKQNIFVIILGTAIISIILSDKIPENITKGGLILAFILGIILSLLHYSKELGDKIEEIKRI